MSDMPKVLFLCSHNSCRSQMAEALLREHGGTEVEPMSAGLDPADIHPLTIEVLREKGIDTTPLRAKAARDFLGKESFRHVIVVCAKAEERCPSTWPFVESRHVWPFEDPAAFEGNREEKIAKFREVRDKIEERVLTFLGGLRTNRKAGGAT